MNFKIRHIVISLFIIAGLIFGVTTLNSKEENLQCDITTITTKTKRGEPAILLMFEYKWSKMPIRLSPDTLWIGWSEGWRVEDFSININNEDVTGKFYNDFDEKSKNDLFLEIDSNENFLSEESFKGEILLVPENISKINGTVYSEAKMQYIHKN
ncbi:hypothetical protein, partial [Anaerosolibacter sp.]|uniref:hypothetical protein n=1 Tax=Anaerosolibacter sp. TaxID=1872527 RepID=UPI0039EE8E68